MSAPPRDHVLSLLAAAYNHGDLAVKLSSLRQAKDILVSTDPSVAAELFPYLADLQTSPESLVRISLIQAMEEIGLKAMDYSGFFMPVLLALLKDGDPVVARQSIITGTIFFCSSLEEMILQFHRRGKVERWLDELWMWMLRFKDAVFAMALEPGSVRVKLMAFKFLETYILLFTSDTNDSDKSIAEGTRRIFNISWLSGGHPILDPLMLMSEANRTLGILLDLLHSASSLPGSLTIAVVNCGDFSLALLYHLWNMRVLLDYLLAAVARKRPIHYNTVFSALLDFDPNFELMKGGHGPSIQYCFRTAFLGFLRCTHPTIMESRDRLVRALRAMNAGDAADQAIRQVDKMMKLAERASRDARLGKDDQPANQPPYSGELLKKRSMTHDNEDPLNSYEVASKRVQYSSNVHSALPAQTNESAQEFVSANGVGNGARMDGELTHVDQMIAMIGALLAEGERGAGSLEILISKMQPDLLADIVVANMKHLPKAPPSVTRVGNLSVNQQIGSLGNPAQVMATSPTISLQSPAFPAQLPSASVTNTSTLLSDSSTINNFPTDPKRDPRRDPRRLDPRRVVVPAMEVTDSKPSDFDFSNVLSKPPQVPGMTSAENSLTLMTSKPKIDDGIIESPLVSGSGQQILKEEVPDGPEESLSIPGVDVASDPAISPPSKVEEDSAAPNSSDIAATIADETSSLFDTEEHSPSVSNASASEEICADLPQLPAYVEMSEEEQRNVRNLAVERIIVSYKHLQGTDCSLARMALLSRLVAQADASDDVVTMVQKHIIVDYQEQKGHELVLQILYHLHSLMVSDQVENSSLATAAYEKFLLTVAKSLLDNFPASDKSFSRLLGEAPHLPYSALQILEDLCYADVVDQRGRVIRDVERVTQGLGAVWSLILGRPCNRQACLSIALKCAIHSQDEIRSKAIRLVANKLYLLSYISENIELFGTNMLLSAVDRPVPYTEVSQSESTEQRAEGQNGNQETSVSGSQISEAGTSEIDSGNVLSTHQSVSTMSISESQRLISLFFALCTKKPSLLQLVFDVYGRSPKAVKQAVHRHMPILIRALGSSHSELLRIVSDPPQGTENLLMAVLQVLTQEATPSPDLIATVKHLYETKLKDATILIPMLSSLSKEEVLPIFPRLVNLPLDKFQTALAHILQGSAHTGPALTPAEVLVAIHDIRPEKDGLPLKKITDACSACFEQRTVFTQQVLAKALNQMVDQTPLPLLFMRSVIQAIDAFPALVDFVMEILSKLVSRQVWKMPKLWVGFLKCVSQTQPHSFRVFLQLPPPQLESALNRHANLRGSLAAYASQPSIRTSLPRSTLAVLGLVNDTQTQQSHLPPLPPDTGSSVHGTTLT